MTTKTRPERVKAYAQSTLPDTEQNAVDGRGDGGDDDAGFRRGSHDNDRHYGMGARGIPDPTDGTSGEMYRSARDERARAQRPVPEKRARPRSR